MAGRALQCRSGGFKWKVIEDVTSRLHRWNMNILSLSWAIWLIHITRGCFFVLCVCVQLVWPNKHVGGESKVLRDLGQAKNIFMTNQILEMLYAYVNISQTVCDILKFCPFLYSTRSCECMYSYISVPTHINYHPVFFRHVVNSEKAKQWQPDQSIRWIYQIKIHLPSLLAPGWLIFPHLCFSSWSPASVSVALPSLQPTECAPAPSTDIIVANEQICCSLISSI